MKNDKLTVYTSLEELVIGIKADPYYQHIKQERRLDAMTDCFNDTTVTEADRYYAKGDIQ